MNIKWNEVTWYTRVCSYILLFVIFFLGFYIGGRYQDLQQIINTTKNTTAQKEIHRIYTNKDLGFQITFPLNWSKVKIQADKKNNSVDFSMMHSLGAYVKVFSINRFTQDEWKNAQNSFNPTIKITDSGDYVFAYVLGKDDEGFVGFPDIVYGAIYQGPYYDVQTNIIPTFNLIQNPS